MTSKGFDQTARITEALLDAHTTLLEISCRGSFVKCSVRIAYDLKPDQIAPSGVGWYWFMLLVLEEKRTFLNIWGNLQ